MNYNLEESESVLAEIQKYDHNASCALIDLSECAFQAAFNDYNVPYGISVWDYRERLIEPLIYTTLLLLKKQDLKKAEAAYKDGEDDTPLLQLHAEVVSIQYFIDTNFPDAWHIEHL